MKLKNIFLLSLILLSSTLFANTIGNPFVNQGHERNIRTTAFVDNGKYILSSGNDKIIKLWRTDSGQLIKTFKGHTKYVDSIVVSSDNSFFISGSGDGSIKVWDIKQGTLIRTLHGHLKAIKAISLSEDNSLLVSTSMDKTIKVWNIKQGTELTSINKDYGDNSFINNIVFHNMFLVYTYVLTEDKDRKSSVFLFDLKNNKETNMYTAKSNIIDEFITSNDFKFMILELDNRIELVSLETLNIIQRISKNNNIITSLSLSPDNNLLAMGKDNGDIDIFDLNKETIIHKIKDNFASIKSINFSSDSNHIVAGDKEGQLIISNIRNKNTRLFGIPTNWIIKSQSEEYSIFGNQTNIVLGDNNNNFFTINMNIRSLSASDISKDGKYYIIATKNGGIQFYDIKTKNMIFAINENLGNYSSIKISDNNKYLITNNNDRIIKIWDLENTKLLSKFSINSKVMMGLSISISNDNKYIVTSGFKESVSLWDFQTGKLIRKFAKNKGNLIKSLVTNSNKFIISGSSDGELKLLNIKTGKEIYISKYIKSVKTIDISSDDSNLIITGKSGIVELFNINTKNKTQEFNKNYIYDIKSSSFDKTNKYIISNTPKSIIYWSIKTGKEVLKTISFQNNEWIKITPEGFFDSSKNGAKYLNVLTSPLTVSSIDKFYDTFYRPDLIKKVLNGIDISKYTNDINLTTIIKDGSAPSVSIKNKSQKTKTRDLKLNLEVCTLDNGGYDNLTLYLNNRAVDVIGKDRALKLKKQSLTRKECFTINKLISLQNGENKIGFKATNKTGTIESNLDEIIVQYKGRSNTKPNLHILSIGIDKYRDGDLWLNYSKADAKEFTKSIKQVSKPLFKNIYTYSLTDKDVTKSKVLDMFTHIGAKTTREDVFMLYMAGHGITDAKTGAYFYLPVDFRYKNENSVRENGLSQNDFKLALSKIQAMKSLTILDTCNSGSFAEAMASRGVLQKTAINKLTRATGRATIVASSKDQVALEGYKGHGVFTYTLMEALNGKGFGTDNKITIKELAGYVEDILPDRTYEKWGYEQIPQSYISGNDFPIGVK